MDLRREIRLSDDLWNCCVEHGLEAVRLYANGENARSHGWLEATGSR